MEHFPIFFAMRRFIVVFALVISGFIFFSSSAHANTLYAKSGGGNWSAAGTWSSTGSGGADSSGPPTSATDVIFESGSGGVTIDTAATARSVNMTSGTGSYAGTLTHSSNVTLSIGDGTAGAANVALKLASGMTYTLGSNSTSAISFVSTSATQQSITTAGKTLANVTINGANSSYQLQDALTSSGNFTYTAGATFDTNTKVITLSTSSNVTFSGGGKTYYELDMTGGVAATITGANTFTNLNRTATTSKVCTLVLPSGATTTVTGVLTIAGNNTASGDRVLVQSSTAGTAATIANSGATMTISYTDFQDITLGTSYNASGITGLSGDAGGNSGITFTTGATQYWKTTTTGAKTWSTAANWFLATNGGGGAGRVPLPQDDVVFDASSIGATSTTIQSDMPRMGKTINFTGVTNSPTWSNTTANTLYGSLTLVSGMAVSGSSATTFGGRSSFTITSAGKTFAQALIFTAPGGTYALADSLVTSGAMTLNNGTLDAQNTSVNASVTTATFSSSNSNIRTITMGTGTWSITGSNGTVWQTAIATNLTLNRGNAIQLTYSGSTGTRTFGHGGNAGATESNSPSFAVTAGTDTISLGGGTGNTFQKDLDFTGFAGTLNTINNGATIYGNLTISSGMTLTAGTTAMTFAATSGTKTITSNGKTLDFPITFDGVGGTFQLADNLTVGSTRTVTLTNGTLDANGKNFSMGFFSSNNSNTRTLTMGTGQWSITGSNTVVVAFNTVTNLTFNRGSNPINLTYSGSTGTRSTRYGSIAGGTEANAPDFNVTAGSDIVSLEGILRNADFTGFSGTLSNVNRIVYGNLKMVSGMTLASGTAVVTFGATSGVKTITSAGIPFDFPITFDGVGGTFQLADNLTVGSTRTVTLTNGTLDANGKNFSMGFFSSSNSNARTITMGSGTWTLTGNSGSVWLVSTATNLTLNRGSHPINFTYSGSTGTRLIQNGNTAGGTGANAIDVAIAAGLDTIDIASSYIGDLDFTGFSGTWDKFSSSPTIFGNLTISSGMTLNSTSGAVSFAATSGTKIITTAGKTLGFDIQFTGVGGTWQLADDITLGSTRSITLSNGTLNANNHNVTTGSFASSNSNTRALTMGSGTWTLTGDGSAAVNWQLTTTTGLTFNANTSTIVLNDTTNTSSTKSFHGGGLTYNILTITGENGYINESNTFATLNVNNAGRAVGTKFQAGTTQTITSSFTTNGSSGNLAAIYSDTPGSPFTLSKSSGTVSVDYVSITDSTATGGATWLPGEHSTNGGGNTGWQFIAAPTSFAGTAASNTSITWTWTDNSSNETGFKLYDNSNTLIATINTANTTSYTETGLVKGTSYTRYLVAYNSTSTSNSTSSVTVATNANAPASFSLISPEDNALSNTGLPTFSFYKTAETAGSISSYTLTIGNTSYTGIPASGAASSNPASATDYEDAYTAQYFNEGDGNSTNDTISVTLKGVPISDGKYSWYAKVIDTDGNSTVSTNRTIRIDATKPVIGTLSFAGQTLSTTATDNYSLHEATVTLEKANTLFGAIVSYTALETRTYTLAGTSDSISYTPRSSITSGTTYRYTVTVTDTAGNQTTASDTTNTTSSQQSSAQDVNSLNPETATTDQIITALRGTLPPSILNLPQLEAQAVVRRQLQAAEFDRLLQRIVDYIAQHQGALERGVIALYESISGELHALASAFNFYSQPIFDGVHNMLAFTKHFTPIRTLTWFERVIIAISDGLSSAQHTRIAQGLSNRQFIDKSIHHIIDPMKASGTQIALKARSIYEIAFDKTPTKISNLAMINLTPSSVTVTWDTNHLTNVGKVNYGTSTAYTQEAFELNGLRDHHIVTLNNLNPQTTYYFEVMNQNGQYVFDAYYTVTTPANGQQSPSPRLIPQDAVIQGDTSVPAYTSADPTATVVKTLLPGTILRALKEEQGWVSVLLTTGQEVWIHADAVKLQDHVGTSASAQH